MRAVLITIAAATTTVPSAGGSIVHVPLNQVVPAGSPHYLEHQIGDYYFYFGFISVDNGADRHIGLFNYLPGTFYQFAIDGPAGPLMNLPTGTPIGPSLPFYEQGVSEPLDTATPLEFIAGIQNPNVPSDSVYSWLRITFSPSTDAYTLVDLAFETSPGVPIPAGAIPSPAPFTMIACAAAAISRRRRA